MESPLLLPSSSTELHLIGADGDYRPIRGFNELCRVFWIETVKLWRIGAPISFSIIFMFALRSANDMFVGHIGNFELAATALSVNAVSTFAFGFMFGMGSALETLCGQAYGAGQVELLGIYMQRSILILFFSCFLLLPIYFLAGPLLKLIGQDEDISNVASSYTLKIIPQLFSFAVNFPTQKFLQAQSKVDVMAWIAMVVLIAHFGLLWLFVTCFGWGLNGAAAAFDISYWAIALAQLVYIVVWCKDGWKGLSWAAFQDIWAFVRLSLASAVMLCLQIWYLMSIVILAGHLPNPVIAVGSLSICMNINGWESMLFYGISASVGVRVSNELGQGRPRAAKYSVYVTVFQSLLIGLSCMVIVLATRNSFSAMFTDNIELRRAVPRLAILLGFTMVLNSVQPVISGVAIGGGWQALVAYINLGCYYVFGLPLGILLGYKVNFGVMGIWGGMLAGIALQTLLLLLVLYKTNWNKEVEETTERMRKWGGQDFKPQKLSAADVL